MNKEGRIAFTNVIYSHQYAGSVTGVLEEKCVLLFMIEAMALCLIKPCW